MDNHRAGLALRWPQSFSIGTIRGRTALLFGLFWLASAGLGGALVAGWNAGGQPGLLIALGVACIAVLVAAWIWADSEIVRPAEVLGAIALGFVRGDEHPETDTNDGADRAPLSPWRSVDAMAGALDAQHRASADAVTVGRALLREVNHRIRNNLQMVASILDMEARANEGRSSERARDRVRLLSLAHDKIDASGDGNCVRLDELAADVGRSLVSARQGSMPNLRLELALDPVQTTVDNAVPMAFLIGESLSNALDTSGPNEPEVLTMALFSEADGAIVFTLAAAEWRRRVGWPPNVERVINAFALQIGAEVTHTPSGSDFVRIRLPPNATAD